MRISGAEDQNPEVIHIILDSRGLVLNSPPVSNSLPPSSQPSNDHDQYDPTSSLSPDGSDSVSETESFHPSITSSYFPDPIIDIARGLCFEPDPATSSSQIILLWEVLLMHMFPPSEGYVVAYEDAVPELSSITSNSQSAQRFGARPEDAPTTIAVLYNQSSRTSPLVVVHILPSPPARPSVNANDDDVRSCDQLLTRSKRTFDALAPYSPFSSILMIAAHGLAPTQHNYDEPPPYPFSSHDILPCPAVPVPPLSDSRIASRRIQKVAPPQFRAVLWPTWLTSGEASSLPDERVLHWTNLFEALGMGSNSTSPADLLELVDNVKASVTTRDYIMRAGLETRRRRRNLRWNPMRVSSRAPRRSALQPV